MNRFGPCGNGPDVVHCWHVVEDDRPIVPPVLAPGPHGPHGPGPPAEAAVLRPLVTLCCWCGLRAAYEVNRY